MARKKKLEDDAWMWMTRPFVPGVQPLSSGILSSPPSTSSSPSRQLPLVVPEWPSKPSSFIANYLYYFFLPTPLEQIGTILDPMNLQTPHGRYRTAGGLPRLLLDIAGDVHMMRAALDPSTLPMRDPFIQNPYTAAMGMPDPMAQYPELNDLFAASQS